MLVPFVIVAVIAAGLLVLLVLGRQRTGRLQAELAETGQRLEATERELATVGEQRRQAEERATELAGTVEELTGRIAELEATHERELATRDGQIGDLRLGLTEAEETLRKRTELADAQATQIDAISAARDELQLKLTAAEEQIVTLSARPGVVVGDGTDDPAAETLWRLEVARSERSWRNSVAINPVDDDSPFAASEDPVRTAVEVEASALREDVGALIGVEWRAKPIESLARRVLVVRVAQEMLASASRVPGAASLVVTDADDGGLTMTFEPADDGGAALNLISPPVSTEMIDVAAEDGLSVTVRAD